MWRRSTKIGLPQLWPVIVVLLAAAVRAAEESPETSTEASADELPPDSFDPALVCSMVENETFLKAPTACDTWIQCVDGEPVAGKCPAGLFYDVNKNTCVDPSAVKCYSSDPCATTVTNGFVADPYSCNGYYYCFNGKGTRGQCSAGLNFNPGTEDCIRDFACTLVDPDGWCNIVPSLAFFSDPLNCQAYHLCLAGVLQNGTCADGYYFDAFHGVCGYQADVKCNVPPLHPDLPGDGICETAGQFVSDKESCAGYYYCKQTDSGDFLLIWGHCPTGRFFDSANGGECVDRRSVVCDYDRCDGLGFENIQLANAPDDGCKGYLMCQDGKEIGRATCPADEEYFNEVTQRCTSQVIDYKACEIIATTTAATTEAPHSSEATVSAVDTSTGAE